MLGSATAQVKEFLPDRMKIETQLSKAAPRGWIQPKKMHASVALANLYGTPATDRRVTGKVELEPAAFSFPEFRDFTFFDPLFDENKSRTEQTVDLGEQKTDGEGHTDFDLQLERFADATYAMRFIAEGFEGEGGRSVTGDVGALVSALPYVIGYKADGDLRYIEMNKPRGVDLVAVDPQLNRIAIENISLNLIAQEYVSVLKKQENGNYVYESVLKERPAKSEKISVASNGYHYALPTEEPGDYVLELRDDQNRILSKLRFSVVGHAAMTGALEKNAELQIKLNAKEYRAGDEIELSVTAPYSGYGLITIEREKVYAYSWFQTNTASSIQHIRLPQTGARFQGNFCQPAQLRRRPIHCQYRKPPTQDRAPGRSESETGRTVAHQLQDRPAQQDRHFRGRSGNSASYRLQNAGSANLSLPQMRSRRGDGADR